MLWYTVAMEKAWYILRVATDLSEGVLNELSEHEVYAPSYSALRYNRRMRCNRIQKNPLFPGYLFMNIRHPRDVRLPHSKQIFGFVRNHDRSYSELVPQAYKLVRQMERDFAEHGHLLDGVAHAFRPGTAVQILSGVFKDYHAIVTGLVNNKLLKVTIEGVAGSLGSPLVSAGCVRATAT